MKKIKRINKILGLVGLFILLTSTFASAEILDKSDQWKSYLAIYGWLPAINGDIKVKGLENDLDVSYSDI